MARNPALWIRVPNGGTPDNPAVYTAIRDSLREISEAVRLLQGGPSVTSSATQQAASSAAAYTNSGPNIYLPLAGGTMTGLLVTAAPTTGSAGLRLPHGTAPSTPTNGDIWTTTSGLFAYINGTVVGPFSAASGVYLPLAGGTMTGLLTTAASGTSSAGFNLPHGAAPTTPVNGDLWTTTTGIYARINGATVGPLIAGSYLPLAGGTMAGAINMNNSDITNVNLLSFNDPGAAEGINWLGGNLWRIYEAPNALTNAAGNLQFTRVISGTDTRLMTLDTSGNLDVIGALTLGTVLAVSEGGTGADLSATGGTGQYVKQATLGGAFTVGTIPASDIASGQALTRVNDTNVTLTLGGAPTTALLAATSLTLGWSGQLSIARGGTGQSTATAAFDALSPLTTLGDIIYHDGTDNVRLAGNTTTTRLFLAQTGTGTVSAAPTWTNVAAADVVSGAALTEVDDTNVTLTLGGTPTSALLKAVTLTLGWTGHLAQSRGGFGADISSVLQNRVYASPNGSAGSPTFRALVAADIPSLSSIYLPLAGGTMSGSINMNSNDLTNVDGISATQVFIGAAVSGGNPFYAQNTDTTFTDAFRDLGFFNYTVSPSAASPTTQYTSMYASTTINSVNTISNRVRAVWGEILAQTAIANVSAVYGDITLTGTANTTNAIAIHAGAPVASSTGRITGYAAGVYIDAQTGGAVTGTAYGIYQAGTSDVNYYGGRVFLNTTDGTTDPNARLLVREDTNGATGMAVRNNDTGTAALSFLALNTSTTGLVAYSFGSGYTTSGLFEGNGTALVSTKTNGLNIGATNAAGLLKFYTGGSASGNERMRIASNGNVTVDTNVLFVDAVNNRIGVNMTPTVALDVTGDAAVSGALTLTTTNLGYTTSGLQLRSSVPGASSSTDYFFHRGADTTVMDRIVVHTPNTSGAAFAHMTSGGVTRFVSDGNTGNFTVDGGTLFVDAANNRVGVGTTSPSYPFHVNYGSVVGQLVAAITNTDTGSSSDARLVLFNSTTSGGIIQRSTGSTTEPSDLVVFSSSNNLRLYTGGVARHIIKNSVTTLTNNTPTTVFSMAVGVSSFAGATILYTIEAFDGTNIQCATGIAHVAIARNSAGTFATGQVTNTVTTSSATSGTLTITWSAPTGADPSLVQVNANSSLAVSAGYPRIRYTIIRNGSGNVTLS